MNINNSVMETDKHQIIYKNIISIQKIFGYIFIFSCLNPWTSFGTNSMDSQPWALLFGVIYLIFLRNIKIPPYFELFFLCVTFGLTISIGISIAPPLPDIARAVASYGTLVVVYLAFYNHLLRFGFPKFLFIISGISWIIFALVEIIAPSITSIISVQRTSEERGLTSLAPEPTYFAIFLLFFSWILAVKSRYKPDFIELFLIIISLLSIIILARSAMVILYLATAAFIYCIGIFIRGSLRLKLKKKHFFLIIFVLLLSIGTIYSIDKILSESRVGQLISQIMDLGLVGILEILSKDASISRRLEDSILSVHAALANFGAPGGIDTYLINREYVRDFWGNLFWYSSTGNKIMSWNGVLLYELGIFGLFAYFSMIFAARVNRGARNTEIAILITLLVGAIPIAFPLIPMLFALWAYLGQAARS